VHASQTRRGALPNPQMQPLAGSSGDLCVGEIARLPWIFQRWYRLAGAAWLFWILPIAYDSPNNYALSTRGRLTEAIISGPVHYKPYLATYEYSVQGQQYKGEVSTPDGVRFSNELLGRPLTVTYDPEHPSVNQTGDHRKRFIAETVFLTAMVTGLSVLTGLFGTRYVRMRARKRGFPTGAA